MGKFLKVVYALILITAIVFFSYALYYFIRTNTVPWKFVYKEEEIKLETKDFEPSGIKSIRVNVPDYDIKIVGGDSDKLVLRYPDNVNVIFKEGNKFLDIKYKKHEKFSFFEGMSDVQSHRLTMEVPKGMILDEMDLASDSGDILVAADNDIGLLRLENVSGDIELKKAYFKSANIANVSGDSNISIEKEFESMNVSSVSGDINIKSVSSVDFNVAEAYSLSGDVDYDKYSNGKSGINELNLNTVSGDIEVE